MKLSSTFLSSALVLTLGASGQEVHATAWEDDSSEAPGSVEILSTNPEDTTTAVSPQEHPALALKRANPAAYDAPATLAAMEETICGTDDLQYVNAYDGTLGPTTGFVQNHKTAVAALATSASGKKYCSGTLVGRDLFLTASHCVDSSTIGHVAAFNFELAGAAGTAVLTQRFFTITGVVHDNTSLDFALLRLGGEPGATYPWTAISSSEHADGTAITIIQHPAGLPKQVQGGTISSHTTDYYRYGNVDTLGGSSGSGILNAAGELIGVHTNGGCTPTNGENSGLQITRALQLSAALAAAAGRTPIVLASDFDADGGADLVQAFRGWASLPRCVSQPGKHLELQQPRRHVVRLGLFRAGVSQR